jgi:LacI family transcriptional regulator
MVTMKDVAEKAGVSVATVSRVMNQNGYVRSDVQARVLEAMRQLNYQPSLLARSLRRQETRAIGLLIPQLDHPFFSTLAFAIEKALFAQDYRTLICSAEENAAKEEAYIDMLLRQRVDGVIFVPTGHSAQTLARLQAMTIPAVLVDRDLAGVSQVNKVLSNNVHGGYLGMRHLLELGHRRIGIIGAHEYSDSMAQRLHGAQQALAEYGLSNPPIVLMDTLSQFEMGYSAGMRLLRLEPRPTAIFALTDVIAVGVLHAAAELAIRLPQELSVVGFDDIPLAAYSIPALTTIAQPITEMGEQAVEILLRHIQQPDLPVEVLTLATHLVVRHSTAAP